MSSVCSPEYIQDLKNRYALYLKAEQCILTGGQEYTIGDRTLRRGDLKYIATKMQEIANDIAKCEAGKGVRFSRIVPGYDS